MVILLLYLCVWITDKEVSTTDKPSTSTGMPAPASSNSATRTEEEETPTPTTTTTATATTTTTPKKQSQFVKPKELKPRTRGAPCRDVEKPGDSLKEMVMKMDDLLGSLPFAHSPLPPSPPPVGADVSEVSCKHVMWETKERCKLAGECSDMQIFSFAGFCWWFCQSLCRRCTLFFLSCEFELMLVQLC